MRTATVEPLVDGEALNREAFERRYQAMPDARAELIEGGVYVTSPTRRTRTLRRTASWSRGLARMLRAL